MSLVAANDSGWRNCTSQVLMALTCTFPFENAVDSNGFVRMSSSDQYAKIRSWKFPKIKALQTAPDEPLVKVDGTRFVVANL
jgi:hypothetical protein